MNKFNRTRSSEILLSSDNVISKQSKDGRAVSLHEINQITGNENSSTKNQSTFNEKSHNSNIKYSEDVSKRRSSKINKILSKSDFGIWEENKSKVYYKKLLLERYEKDVRLSGNVEIDSVGSFSNSVQTSELPQSERTTKNPQDTNKIFYKRKGTTNKGHQFEDLMISLISLRLTTDSELKNFNLSANDDSYGGMDDIIFDLQTTGGSQEKYAMQLKYSNKRNSTLTKASLTGVTKNPYSQNQNGDFNIVKYFKEYQKIRNKSGGGFKFVLCTNKKFGSNSTQNYRKLETLDIEDGLVTLKVEIIERDLEVKGLEFYRTSGEKCKCYIFKIVENSDDSELNNAYKLFFENFIFLPNYMHLDEIKRQIEGEFRKKFQHKGNAHSGYLEYIHTWSQKEGKKIKLDKKLITEIITLLLVSPHIKTLQPIQEELSAKEKLFKEAVSFFKITILHPCQDKKLSKFWCNINEFPEIQTLYIQLSRYNILPPNIRKIEDLDKDILTKSLWLIQKTPLVVYDHEDVRTAIEISKNLNLKFVLLTDKIDFDNLWIGVFQNLQDLRNLNRDSYRVYQMIIENFRYVLEEKSILLVLLINLIKNKNVAGLITIDELLSLADDSLKLDTKTNLPPAYIERFLSRNVINPEFLKNLDGEILVLISCCAKEDILKICDSSKIMFIKDINGEKDKFLQRNHRKIFVFEDKCDSDELDRLCLEKNIKYHHFKLFENDKLEWIRSNCDISEMKEYLINGYYFPESEIPNCESENNVNIICDKPGMGKTTLMKNIRTKSSSKIFWTILIAAKNHFQHFQKNENGDVGKFQEYLLEGMKDKITNFENEVLKWIMEKKFVRYIWDGLDELSEENLEVVKILIDKLSKDGSKHWVSSRTNLRSSLEHRYKVIARSIKTFEKEDQEEYLEKRLRDVSESFNKQNIKRFLKHEFLEIPLQIFVLTELLLQNSGRYASLFEEPFTIPDLYKHFIDTQFNLYYSRKLGINYYENDARFIKFLKDKEDHISNYESVAVMLHFRDIVPEQTRFIAENFLNKLKKSQDEFGIITKVENGTAEFFHTSFGEYFAVSYLVKNIKDFFHLKDRIFANDNILYLFNIIISNPHKAHKAVITRNFKLLKECSAEELKIKDKAGRHALHLACTLGTKYPLLRVENNIIDDRQIYWQDLKPEPLDYLEALKLLIKHCDPNDFDKFGLNCFLYAYNNTCFCTLAMLNEEIQMYNMDMYYSVLYYCLRFNYDSLFEKIETVPLIKSRHFNKSLLYVAVYYNSVHCLDKILSNPKNSHYKEIVEMEEEGLLVLALENENYEIVHVFYNNGAPLRNKVGRLPIKRDSSKRHRTADDLDKLI